MQRTAAGSWVFAAMMLACRPAPAPNAAAADAAAPGLAPADRAAILHTDSLFETAANTGSIDGVAGIYADDASLLPPNEPLVKGRAAVRQFWGRFMDAYTLRFELATEEVDGRADLAYVRGHYKLTASPKAKGGAVMQDEGKFVEVFKRQSDGNWRYVIDIYNSDLAAK